MLGLAATAALAVLGVVGPSSAMGEGSTLLCKNLFGECEVVKHLHILSVNSAHESGKGKLLAGSNTVECELLGLGDVLEPYLGNPVQILAELTYTNCNLGCSTGTPTGGSPHGEFDILRLGVGELADVIGLEFEFKLTCPFIFTCDYNSENLVGHGLPLNNEANGLPHVTYTGATLNLTSKLSGPFNCPSTGALDLLLQSLTQFYVRG
jgi:hypothetical protein